MRWLKADEKLSDRMVDRIASGKMRSGYSRGAMGKREDLGGRYFRSSWEANYARYLNLMISQKKLISWEYEVKTFVFESIKRGTRAYTPDFKCTFPDGHYEWHEVKGWMDPKSVTRLKRMEKFFPGEKVVVIGSDWFRQANRGLAAVVPGWERGGKRKNGGEYEQRGRKKGRTLRAVGAHFS